MRSTITLVSFLASAAIVSAQEIDNDDIPQQCRDVCRPVVQLADRCDNLDGDTAERNCLCETQNAADFTSCNDCTLQYPDFFIDNDDDDDDNNDNNMDDNEVNIWFNRCNFGAGGASGITSSASSTTMMTSTAVVPVSTSISVSCDDDDDDDDNNCSTSTVVVVSQSTGVVSITGAGGASPTPSTGGGAAGAGSNNDNDNDDNNDNVATVTEGGSAAATGIPVLAAGLLAAAMAAL